MKKIAKIAIKTLVVAISVAVLLVVVMPLALSLLLSLPSVQTAVVHRLTEVAGERLGTKVSVDRVAVKLLNRVELEGFLVEDFQRDTLLYVGKMVAPIEKLGFGGEPLTFGRVRLEGAEVWLRRDSTGTINIKQVVNAIRGDRPSNPDSKFRMRIAGIDGKDIKFGLFRYDKPFKDRGIDWSRFALHGIDTTIDDFRIAGDTIRMDIRALSAVERTGWTLQNLEAHDLVISRGAVVLDNVKIVSGDTDMKVPYVRLVGRDRLWDNYRNFLDSVSLDVAISPSRLTTGFLGYFVPFLNGLGPDGKGVDLTIGNFVARTSGPVSRFVVEGGGEVLQAGYDDLGTDSVALFRAASVQIPGKDSGGTIFGFDFRSRGLPNLEKARFEGHLAGISTTEVGIDQLMGAFTGKSLPVNVRAPLDRLGKIGLTARFAGGLTDFDASGVLTSAAGDLDLSARVGLPGLGVKNGATGGVATIDGAVSTDRFNVGGVFDVKDLGIVAGDVSVNGAAASAKISGEATADLKTIEYRGYGYAGTTATVKVADGNVSAKVRMTDPGMSLDAALGIDKTDKGNHYDVDLNLHRGDLRATGINRRDSVSVLGGHLTARFSGTRLDDMNGSAQLQGAVYRYTGGKISAPPIMVSAHSGADGKRVSLRSDFADGDFRSRISYNDMIVYLHDFLRGYIPVLGGKKNGNTGETTDVTDRKGAVTDPKSAQNYSVLSLKFKDTERILAAVAPGTEIAPGSELSFMFNPYVRSFSLSARSQFIQYQDILAGKVELNSDNKSDSLTVHLTTSEVYAGRLHIPNFALHGGAKDGRMTLSTRLIDRQNDLSALLGLRVDFRRDDNVRIRFTPSYLSFGGRRWHIVTRAIDYKRGPGGLLSGGVEVGDLAIFSAENPAQRITANGRISQRPTDTLRVRFADFDLSPLGALLADRNAKAGEEEKKLTFGGFVDGEVDMVSPPGSLALNAELDLNEFTLNDMTAPPLHISSVWNNAGQKIDFRLNNRNSAQAKAVAEGSFVPKTASIEAHAAIQGLDMGLLDPLLGGVIKDTKGRADADLNISGTVKKLKIGGGIDVSDFETTVGFTGVAYTLERAKIRVENSRLRLPKSTIRDKAGNRGEFGMAVDLSNPRAIGVDIEGALHRMLAFDTTAEDNDAFYGHVIASGQFKIHAGDMGSRIEITAQTEPGSDFHLPLSAKSNISWADFVQFVDLHNRSDTTDILARKKYAFERRQQSRMREKRRKPLDLDLTVRATPDVEVDILIDPNLGRGIRARGEGVLNLKVNPATDLFSMTGDYNITDGKVEFAMMEVIRKEFTIQPGSSLRWSGEADDAALDVEASYRVRTSLVPLVGEDSQLSDRSSVPVDCVLLLGGTLSQPDITFDIRLPSADVDAKLIAASSMNTQELKSMQFLSLLMTGNFASGNSITGQNTAAGSFASGAIGFDILTSQLSSLLSNDKFNVYFKYRPQTELRGNQFDVGFSTGIVQDRLLLEIEGNYVQDRAATNVTGRNASNLAGDVSLTWVIDKSGNLRLKIFSQTIDRLNETQGLQESGVGVYWKKDFDKIGDIFKRKKSNFGADSLPPDDDSLRVRGGAEVKVKKTKKPKKNRQ